MPRLRVTRASATGAADTAAAAAPAPSVPWTPTALTSVAAWWDASDSATVTYSSGTSVSSWSSKVGSYALTQATSSKQPSHSGSVNGKTTLVFDGTSDGLSVSNFDMTPGGQKLSMWVVGTAANTADDMVFAEHSINYNGTTNGFICYRTAAKTLHFSRRGNGTWAAWESTSLLTTTPVIGVSTHDGTLSTNESQLYFNGALNGAAPGGFNADTNTTNLNDTLFVGSRANSSLYLNGQICEIGFTTGTMSLSDRQKLEGYLAHKWGLTASLPSDHPYKAAPPTLPSVNYDPDATTYIAAVEAADGQSLESGVKTAINDFIVGCKADGNWSALKASCILAGARTLAGALVPLVGTAPTNFSFVSADYNRKTGLVGNGSTKYLDSNRANNADPQNSQHFGVYFSNQGTSAFGIWIGVFHSPEFGSSYFYRNTNSQVLHVSRRSSTEINTSVLIPDNSYMGVSRAAAGSYSFRMSSTTYSYTMASSAPAADSLHVFRLNRATNNLYMNARIAFYSIGEAVDLALLDTRLTTLMSALATAIP